ncbi:GTP-binding protein [Phreatobacter stygius]|uniref:GTP-binding protein n=1 Tax=Phreatobacter stygius TaxID=1940610 RepID=A0A4D7ATR8_9HYPH|nr:GTP-binding protein [Phreatobacter stygius]
MSWTADAPLSLPRFQAAIGKLSPHLVRAKGFVAFREQAGRYCSSWSASAPRSARLRQAATARRWCASC